MTTPPSPGTQRSKLSPYFGKKIVPSGAVLPQLTDRLNTSPIFSNKRDLPVLGRAQGGSDGNMALGENAIDWTFRPADLQGVRDAFAVYVTGDSMVPKYKNQDLAYVHPNKRPVKGRFVLVETTEHKGFIKQFVKWEGNELVLQQFNPATELRLPRDNVLRVMMVIGSLDA
ncbi:MAG: helix-turn-helix transcriptional regulator [Alphaproteobacteria bacterium]|nr:helix-turn-helix transcriptional regulator [Alphaproteobacteria bacterium]